jgi:hypothetical protein
MESWIGEVVWGGRHDKWSQRPLHARNADFLGLGVPRSTLVYRSPATDESRCKEGGLPFLLVHSNDY